MSRNKQKRREALPEMRLDHLRVVSSQPSRNGVFNLSYTPLRPTLYTINGEVIVVDLKQPGVVNLKQARILKQASRALHHSKRHSDESLAYTKGLEFICHQEDRTVQRLANLAAKINKDRNSPEKLKSERDSSKRKPRTASLEELEEDRRFEEQKRALEERAERLRRLSFNVRPTDSEDDASDIPAFVRRNVKLQKSEGSKDESFLSDKVIGPKPSGETGISPNTLNTFLEGKKPD